MAMDLPRRSLPNLDKIPPLSLAQYKRPDLLSFRYDAEDLYDTLRRRPDHAIDSLEHFDDSLRLLSESMQLAMIGQLEGRDDTFWNEELRWYHSLSDRFYQLTADTLIPLLSPDVIQSYAGHFGRNFFYHVQNVILRYSEPSMDAARDFRRSLRGLRLHLSQGGRAEHWSGWQHALEYHEQVATSFGFENIYAKQQQILGFTELDYDVLTNLLREVRRRFVPLYTGLLEMYDTSEQRPWLSLEQDPSILFYLPIYGTNASPQVNALSSDEWFYQLSSELMAAEFSQVIDVRGNYLREMQRKSYIRFETQGKIPGNTRMKLLRYRLNSAQVLPQLYYLSDAQLPVLFAPNIERLTDIPSWFHAFSEYTWQLLHSDSDALFLQFDGVIQRTLIQMFLGEAMSWDPIRENRYALSAFDQGRGELFTTRRLFQLIEEILVAAAVSEWSIMSFRTRTITLQESFEIWPEILANYGLDHGVCLAELKHLQALRGSDGIKPSLSAILREPFAVVGGLSARLLGLAYWDQLQQSPKLARKALGLYMDQRLQSTEPDVLKITGLPDPHNPETIRRLAYKLAFALEK